MKRFVLFAFLLVVVCACMAKGNLPIKVFAEENVNSGLIEFGFPKTPVIHGSVDELDKHYKLDKESICEIIKEEVNGRKDKIR